MKISYYSEDLIEQLKRDIERFGGDEVVLAWKLKIDDDGTWLYTNYDFITSDMPVRADERPCEELEKMTMDKLLEKLVSQYKIN